MFVNAAGLKSVSNPLVLKLGQIYFCFAVDTINVQQQS